MAKITNREKSSGKTQSVSSASFSHPAADTQSGSIVSTGSASFPLFAPFFKNLGLSLNAIGGVPLEDLKASSDDKGNDK